MPSRTGVERVEAFPMHTRPRVHVGLSFRLQDTASRHIREHRLGVLSVQASGWYRNLLWLR